MPKPFKTNIEKATLENNAYRHVIYTTPQTQLVLMSIPSGESIGMEKHPHTTQFIRVESGSGTARVGAKRYRLTDGDVLIIPPNTLHDIKSTHTLKLYTLYSPPEHKDGLVQKVKMVRDNK